MKSIQFNIPLLMLTLVAISALVVAGFRITTYHRPVRVLKATATVDIAGFDIPQTAFSGFNPASSPLIGAPKPEAGKIPNPLIRYTDRMIPT